VVCVDNEPEILAGMSALMSRWGLRVLTAPDGATMRALVATERPAVVLADYRLAEGESDGLELLREVCTPDDSGPVGALVTADHSTALAERARELGFPMLRKPLKPAALRALLGALAAQRPVRSA
jgi:DNA-binding response OmpR family regulator